MDQLAETWDIFQHDGRVRWFAKDSARRYGGWLDSATRLGAAIEVATQLGRDFYLQANVCRPGFAGVKCATRDITHWRMVVLDYDPASGDPGGLEVPAPVCNYPLAGDLDMGSMCVGVHTGRGWQYWLRLRPWEVRQDHATIERGTAAFIRRFREHPGWKVDTSCSDLARVVRCPGSVNTKTNERAAIVSSGHAPDIHGTILSLAGPPPEPATPVAGVESGNLLGVLPHLNASSRGFILRGLTAPGRHARAFSTTKNLHEVGASREQAERWVQIGANYCNPPLPPGDVGRIIKQVYGGAQ